MIFKPTIFREIHQPEKKMTNVSKQSNQNVLMIILYWNEQISRNCVAKEKVNAYSEKLFPSNDCLSIWGGSPVKFMTSRETQE